MRIGARLPNTLITRSVLHNRLTEAAGKRLTVVVGSAGTGQSVLLSSWAAIRPSGVTSWMSCDEADANPLRFWTAFIEAPREMAPGFGADAAELLSMDNVMSADVTASIVNDVATLPAGSAIIVNDFHTVASAVSKDMTELVERWPAEAPSWCWQPASTLRCGCTGGGCPVSWASSAITTCISR